MSVAIAHPRAPTAPGWGEACAPYLLRDDGVVLPYNAGLARLPGFRPLRELPRWHVEQIEAARVREAVPEVVQARLVEVAANDTSDVMAVERALVSEATSRQALRDLCARHGVKTEARLSLSQLRELADGALRPMEAA